MDDFWLNRETLAENEAIVLVRRHGRFIRDPLINCYTARIPGLHQGRAFFANDTAVLRDKIKEALLKKKYPIVKDSAD